MELTIIMPDGENERLCQILEMAGGSPRQILRQKEEMKDFLDRKKEGARLLFALSLDEFGINPAYYDLLSMIRRGGECLAGTVCGLLVDGKSEWYTKSVGKELALAISEAGGLLVGRPLTEGTGSLKNYRITAGNLGVSLMAAYAETARLLTSRILTYKEQPKDHPRLLCLYASDRKTSNTMRFWELIRKQLPETFEIREISLRNGEINDCAGCSFPTCMHFSNQSSCFYGGTMVDAVYPAVEECDGLLLLCPNYNDAIDANASAFINRLTALFRKRQFYEKKLFAVVVSGYSGSDIVAGQLLSALGMNKTFIVPPHFAVTETAYQRGEILEVAGIEEKARAFADHIIEELEAKKPIR